MQAEKKGHPKVKSNLHPRSKHKERYDFKALIQSLVELGPFVHVNKYGDESINFFDPKAVTMLNKALMKHFYGIEHWDIPKNYLSPPIPGRADYLHYAADLLAGNNTGKVPNFSTIKCFDIGVGASCIYPILGTKEFQWSFIGSDIDKGALDSSQKIIDLNPSLKGKIELRLQKNNGQLFNGVIHKDEMIDLTICNPPLHASREEAEKATRRKLTNLKRKKITKAILNFGGISAELWCEGGEKKFILDMINESKRFGSTCFWFTSLVSKEVNLKTFYKELKAVAAVEVVTIPMGQGNKTSRIIAWTFLQPAQQNKWVSSRWKP